ncbi:MAG: flagellar hook assembly protein FlgD, partial [Gammaproteobacteria bacterium]
DGVTHFRFDGRDASGARLPPGSYRIEGQTQVGSAAAGAEITLAQRIDSVTIGARLDDLKLNLAGGETVGFSSVREFL